MPTGTKQQSPALKLMVYNEGKSIVIRTCVIHVTLFIINDDFSKDHLAMTLIDTPSLRWENLRLKNTLSLPKLRSSGQE